MPSLQNNQPVGDTNRIFDEKSPVAYWHNWGVRSPGVVLICLVSCCLLKEFLGIKHTQVFPHFRPYSPNGYVGFVVFPGLIVFMPVNATCLWRIFCFLFIPVTNFSISPPASTLYTSVSVYFFYWVKQAACWLVWAPLPPSDWRPPYRLRHPIPHRAPLFEYWILNIFVHWSCDCSSATGLWTEKRRRNWMMSDLWCSFVMKS